MLNMATPLLAVRGRSESHSMCIDEWNLLEKNSEGTDVGGRFYAESPKKQCRVMEFSHSGKLFAFCNSERTVILETSSMKEVASIPVPKAIGLMFSPDDKILCTMELFVTSKDCPEAKNNLILWNTQTWDPVAEFVHKKSTDWQPGWLGNTRICARKMSNSVFFYSDYDFEKPAAKLHLDKLDSYSLSINKDPPYRVACFVKGTKGGPSSVKIYNYPNFGSDELLASKSFFKADTVKILWNAKGNAILIRAATEVDTTGASYYGEQNLHYMNCNGDTSMVQLPKNGPIYDAAWDPDSTKFCVTYGFMPAKASVFNHKCNIIHDFGASPKNMCVYNPQGNLLILAGFGNLRGNVEVWHNGDKEVKQIAQFEAADTTHLDWFADGEHFVTSTVSPRLRVNNGYKIWHFSSSVPLVEKAWSMELNKVKCQPFPSDFFKAPKIVASAMQTTKPVGAPKPQSYVPPHARGRADYSASKVKQDPDESVEETTLSKSAMKNKKKREAKKKQHATASSDLSQGQKDAVAMAQYLLNDPPQSKSAAPVANDNEKKIKNLRKKIQTIEKLKTQQKEGKVLEKNQLEKIATQESLIAQLRDLEMNG